MNAFRSLPRRDRILLVTCAGMVLLMIVVVALFGPRDDDDSPIPRSDSAGRHGAKAAYMLLERSGYKVEHWSRPLQQLNDGPSAVGDAPHTTLVLAEPWLLRQADAQRAIQQFLDRGGRVMATGLTGGMLLPDNQVEPSPKTGYRTCEAIPNGFIPLAASGDVQLYPKAAWRQSDPRQRTVYLCGNEPVVVVYPYGKGSVVWWADSLPLQNRGIDRADNVNLLLNSVGAVGSRIIWDESQHGEGLFSWSLSGDRALQFVCWQLALVALLLLWSRSRRSGPLRSDPVVARDSSLEFVQSLGTLYHRAGATNTAVTIAYQQFRRAAEKQSGVATDLEASQAAQALVRRFRYDAVTLGADMAASEEAAYGAPLSERKALALVQALSGYQSRLQKFAGKEDILGRETGDI